MVWLLLGIVFVIFAITAVLGQFDPIWWVTFLIFFGVLAAGAFSARQRRQREDEEDQIEWQREQARHPFDGPLPPETKP